MTQTLSSIRAQIDRTNAAFSEAFRRGNGAGLGAVYTADAQILPPNAEVRRGKPDIQAFWQGALDMGVAAAELETVEFEEGDNTAWEVGKFSLRGKDGRILDTGKYIVVWKREHGAWKWHRDIWNSSRPAPQ